MSRANHTPHPASNLVNSEISRMLAINDDAPPLGPPAGWPDDMTHSAVHTVGIAAIKHWQMPKVHLIRQHEKLVDTQAWVYLS